MRPKYSALLEGYDSVPLHIYTSFQYIHHIRCSNNSKKKKIHNLSNWGKKKSGEPIALAT